MRAGFLAALLIPLVALSACATAGQRTNAAGVSRPAADATTDAAAASARLRSAVGAVDSAALGALLDGSVVFVTLDADTVVGREAVASALLALARDSANPLRLYAGALEACRNGDVAELNGSFTARARRTAPGTRQTDGRTVLTWRRSPSGVAATRLDLAVSRASATRAPCDLMYLASAPAQRNVVLVGLDLSPSSTLNAIGDGMTAQSFDDTPTVVGFEPEPFPRARASIAGVSVAYRRGMSTRTSIEARLAMRAPESTEGTDAEAQRHVVVKTLPVTVGGMLQVRQGLFRAGIGPSLLLPNYSVRETHERIYYVAERSAWAKVSDEETQAQSAAPAFGVASEVTFILPMASRATAELRFGFAAYAPSTVPGTPNFQPFKVSSRVATAGLSVGMARP